MTERRALTKTALVTGGARHREGRCAVPGGRGISGSYQRPAAAGPGDGPRPFTERSGRTRGVWYVWGDIPMPAFRDRLVGTIREEYGGISVLVNNAGVSTKGRKDMLELTENDMIDLLRVNLIAPFLLSAAIAPVMSGQDEPAYIVNISSISAYTVSTNRADYCIAKAGMSMMTGLFADRLAGDNIRVFEVRPGVIRTDMTKPVAEKYDRLISEGLLPIGRWGEPEDVARAVLGIVLGYHPYSTGSAVDVDGGFHIRRL